VDTVFCIARQRDCLPLRCAERPRRAQDHEARPVGHDGVGRIDARGVGKLHSSTKRFGSTREESLPACREFFSDRPALDFAKLRGSLRVARRNSERSQSVSALVDMAQFRAEPIGRQRCLVDSVEPHRTGMPNLRLERERLRANPKTVTGGSFTVSPFELLQQVRRNLPAGRRFGQGEAETLEFAKAVCVSTNRAFSGG
jgi:hypothetical protein